MLGFDIHIDRIGKQRRVHGKWIKNRLLKVLVEQNGLYNALSNDIYDMNLINTWEFFITKFPHIDDNDEVIHTSKWKIAYTPFRY